MSNDFFSDFDREFASTRRSFGRMFFATLLAQLLIVAAVLGVIVWAVMRFT